MNRQIALLWGGVSLALIALSPLAPRVASGLWGCAFKGITGFACPTCGTGRAALALARLDIAGALTHYPLPALAWIAFIGGGVFVSAMTLAGREPPAIPNRIPGWGKIAILAAILLNWAYSIATGV